MSIALLTPAEVARALRVRDLTDPAEGPHALQRIVDDIVAALVRAWRCERACPPRLARRVACTTTTTRSGYTPDAVTRDARVHAVRVGDRGAAQPYLGAGAGRAASARREKAESSGRDVLARVPGNRLPPGLDRPTAHRAPRTSSTCGASRAIAALDTGDLKEMIEIVVRAALPGAEYRVEARDHPYTTEGLQIDVAERRRVGRDRRVRPRRRPMCSRGAGVAGTGLAMGLGLDRILMLRKGIADIRLLRAEDPRIAGQMRDLGLYRPVSNRPAITRDLSIAVPDDDAAEELGDRVARRARRDTGDTSAVETRSRRSPSSPRPPVPTSRPIARRTDRVCSPARRTCSCASCSGIRPGRSRAKRRTGSATRSSTHCTAVRRPGRRGSALSAEDSRRCGPTIEVERQRRSPSRIS